MRMDDVLMIAESFGAEERVATFPMSIPIPWNFEYSVLSDNVPHRVRWKIRVPRFDEMANGGGTGGGHARNPEYTGFSGPFGDPTSRFCLT